MADDTGRPELRLPPVPDLRLRGSVGDEQVFDPVRRIWVALTPEEWVRRHLIHYLSSRLGIPESLLAVEKAFILDGTPRRADVVAYDRKGHPWLLAECKAPGVGVSQAAVDQAARYNSVVGAGFVLVTDGMRLVAWRADPGEPPVFLAELPSYPTG